MRPLDIEILLYYYTRCDDYRWHDWAEAPELTRTIRGFASADFPGGPLLSLLTDAERGDFNRHTAYGITKRGEAYVEALMAVPLPIQVWVMPAPAMEARSGETRQRLDPKGDSAVREAEAP